MNPNILARVVAAGLVLSAGLVAGNSASADGEDDVWAEFEGDWINLAEDWGDAEACWSDESGTRCYRSESEMDDAEGGDSLAGRSVGLLATCASTVRLYDGTSYSGTVMAWSQRTTPISLASYGFDNVTSSYRIGACNAELYTGGYLSGLYPGLTTAGAQSPSMLAGYNNAISTLYIQ